jgi:hypothetical protein
MDGDGDLYVEDEIEVDGVAHFSGGIDAPGAIDSADVSFNYAGSATKGGIANDADLLDGQNGSFYQSATNINAGTLGNGYFSAYSDLTAEGYLDNNMLGDLLNQIQGDGRFVNTTGDDAMAGSLTVGGDLTVTGANIGLGIAPSVIYGIINDSAAAPAYGANLYGTSYGVLGRLSSDPTDHYGFLGALSAGAYGRAGNSDETGSRYGGDFYGHSLDNAFGVYGHAYGYSIDTAYGIYGFGQNNVSGNAEGLHGYGYKTGAGTSTGVVGYGYNSAAGNAYGGYFYTSASGAGTHYGIFADADDYAAWLEGGRVHVGDIGIESYVDGDGDLYVEDELEVDGNAYVNELYYDSAKTYSYAVSRAGEKRAASNQSFEAGLAYNFCPDGVTCGTYFPVNLPERATVTGFYVWGQTGSASHSFGCYLSRFNNSGSFYDLASVSSSNTTMTLSDVSISYGAIDNVNYSYLVECAETTASRSGNVVYIYRIRIDYTINGPE